MARDDKRRSHAKCLLFLSDFIQNRNISTDISYKNKIPNMQFHLNPFSGDRSVPCEQTDMMKLMRGEEEDLEKLINWLSGPPKILAYIV